MSICQLLSSQLWLLLCFLRSPVVIVLPISNVLRKQAEANSAEHNYQHGDREHFESQPVFTWPSQILVVFVSLVQGIDGLAVDLLVGKLLSHVRD